MSDDVFEAFGDDDIFDDNEQKQAEGESQNNRTFIIAVAALGGLLVCAVASFMVWALVLNKPQEVMEAPIDLPTETVMVEVIVQTDTPEPTATPMPTDTPEPSPTPLLGPTSTPTVEGEALAEGGETEEVGEGTATPIVRRTPTPTATSQTVARGEESGSTAGGTASGTSASTELAKTGLGEWILIGAAVFLLATMVLARRLRSA